MKKMILLNIMIIFINKIKCYEIIYSYLKIIIIKIIYILINILLNIINDFILKLI